MIKPSRLLSNRTRHPRNAAALPRDVITHRLFPGLMALWFAALFGLGCLVAGGDALTGLVLHLHLPTVLPAAAPPLGLTARLVLAVVLTGLGGAIGLAIGLALYSRAGGALPARPVRARPAPHTDASEPAMRVRSRDAHPDAPPRRPLVVTQDVLPYPTAMVDTPTENQVDEDRDYDIIVDQTDLPPFLAAAMPAVNRPTMAPPIAPAKPLITLAPPAAPLAEPETMAMAPQAKPEVPAPPISMPPLASIAAAAPKVPLAQLPLTSLGLVQLIERLAQAIAVRQQDRATALDAASAGERYDMRTPLHRFDPLTMDPSGPLLRAKKARADGNDALAHPVSNPADCDQDLYLAADGQDMAADAACAGDDFACEPAVEDRYSSLADMALPRPELVSFAAPPAGSHDLAPAAPDPVVQFPSRLPGSDPAAPAASADRALREALATLRQMTAQR